MNFSEALKCLKQGAKLTRDGWNGKNMWICLVTSEFEVSQLGTDEQSPLPGYLPFLVMFTADKKLVPWLASHTDILANDWRVMRKD